MNQQRLGFATTSPKPSPQSFQNLELNQPAQKTTRSLLLVAATGLGKTVMMGLLARHWPEGRILLVSHRLELNVQAIKTFESICGEECDLEQASWRADQRSDPCRIVVASVQTLCSKSKGEYRMKRFNPAQFSLIMIDEAHHAAAASYKKVVDHFFQNPATKLLGVTATPHRTDDLLLGDVFEDVVCNFDTNWAISQGWLVPPRDLYVKSSGINWSSVKVRNSGDFTKSEIHQLVDSEESIHTMVEPIYRIAKGRQTIVFCGSVAQAKKMRDGLRNWHERQTGSRNQDIAESIDGSLAPNHPVRRRLLERFKAGEIQFLCNMGVLTEGFDHDGVQVIAMCRPTKSRGLYIQMLGRGLRPLAGTVDGLETAQERIEAINRSGKSTCIVIDFFGQSGRHKLCHSIDALLRSDDSEEVREIAVAQIRVNTETDPLEEIQKAREQARKNEILRKWREQRVTVKTDYEIREAPQTLHKINDLWPKPKPADHNTPATQKQRDYLVKLGWQPWQANMMCRQQASVGIRYAIKNPKNEYAKWKKMDSELPKKGRKNG